jgi:hypothetical protein
MRMGRVVRLNDEHEDRAEDGHMGMERRQDAIHRVCKALGDGR